MVSESGRTASKRRSTDGTNADGNVTDRLDDGRVRSRRLRDRIEVATLEAEVGLLDEQREDLRDRIDELEAEVETLEDEVDELEAAAESKDRRRRHIVANYERVLAEKDRDYRSLESAQADDAGGHPSAVASGSLLGGVMAWLRPASGD